MTEESSTVAGAPTKPSKPLSFNRAAKRRQQRSNREAYARGEIAIPSSGTTIVQWDGQREVGLLTIALVCTGCHGGLSVLPVEDEVVNHETPAFRLYCQACQACVPPAEAVSRMASCSRISVELYESLAPGSHDAAKALSDRFASPERPKERSGLVGPDGQPL